jgi:hypothetical protein
MEKHPPTGFEMDTFIIERVLIWPIVSLEYLRAEHPVSYVYPAVARCGHPKCPDHYIVRFLASRGLEPFYPSRSVGAAWMVAERMRGPHTQPNARFVFDITLVEILRRPTGWSGFHAEGADHLWQLPGETVARIICTAAWCALEYPTAY